MNRASRSLYSTVHRSPPTMECVCVHHDHCSCHNHLPHRVAMYLYKHTRDIGARVILWPTTVVFMWSQSPKQPSPSPTILTCMCWSTTLSFSISPFVFVFVCVFLYHTRLEFFFPTWCWDWFFACIHSDGNPCNKFSKNPSCNDPCKEFLQQYLQRILLVHILAKCSIFNFQVSIFTHPNLDISIFEIFKF